MSGSVPESRPAARVEVLDTLMDIDDQAGYWIDKLGGIIPADPIDPVLHRPQPGLGTVLRLRRLHGLHPSAEACGRITHSRAAKEVDPSRPWCCDRGQLEGAVRNWWHRARIVAGWESRLWRPDNSCPVCEALESVLVNLVPPGDAFCKECHTVWDGSSIGILAEHIRAENAEDDTDEPDAA